MSDYSAQAFGKDNFEVNPTGVRIIKECSQKDVSDFVLWKLLQGAAAEDHSERMTPYEGDAGDETGVTDEMLDEAAYLMGNGL